MAQVEGARANLQTILDNLTAGVIVFDRERRDRHRQPGRDPHPAAAALGLPRPPARRGRRPRRASPRRSGSASSCTPTSPEAGERDHWQDAFELQTAGRRRRERDSITLLVRGAAMPQGARLMVFDDITELVSAQRVEAWSEVARRLAHEIKNPLTPIQLSAERLQHKLGAKLEGADQAMLRALGRHHRQPGAGDEDAGQRVPRLRAPAGRRSSTPLDLNALVGEVLGLYGSAQEAGRLVAELADGAAARSSATPPSCAR